MTFLDKLNKLMADNGLNKKSLSQNSNIAYTTIINWYKRGYDNMTISILKKLCDYFGVTMDSMVRDEIAEIEYYNPNKRDLHISKEEELLIRYYRAADDLDKSLAMRAVKADENKSSEKKNQNAG